MIKIHAYLNFDGQCEEAFLFYEKVFQTRTSNFIRFTDMPSDPDFVIPDSEKNKIMHTSIKINDNTMLMGSDIFAGFGQKLTLGNNTYVMLDTDTADEAKRLYSSLTEGAQVIEMELDEQPWAELYASFQDRFGIWWMVHYEGNKAM